jgi:NAD-dependent dihydropyrimidine dehydrogenase PreA subunit
MNSLPKKSLCLGCRACVSACPKKALSMENDSEGFGYPCLDPEKCNSCKTCNNVCPLLSNHFKPNRSPVKHGFAVRSDNYAPGSTSGGAFAAFAHKILSNDGFVAGAVYDSEWKVVHIISNKFDDINRMRGSKYLQSDIGNTYKEAKLLLDEGKKLLFSGTPCQIAGLYGFLGKDYENLLTVDLICYGVNSPSIWKRYIDDLEVSEGQKIISVIHRNKIINIFDDNSKCERDHFTIVFANGKIITSILDENNFIKGFFQNLFLRLCCFNCQYTRRIRPGDITIGDFWAKEASEDRKEGISQVLLNSKKGHIFFDTFENEWGKKYQINLNKTKHTAPNINGISTPHNNPNRQRFFDLCQNMSYNKAIDYIINKKYEIAIIGMHAPNYGNLLTAHAMYKIISDMGKTVLMLDRPLTSTDKPSKDNFNIFLKNPYPDYALSDIYINKNSMKELNDRIGIFLLPSDQILRPSIFLGYDKYTLLDWVRDDKPKIAYASSFGTTFFEGDDNLRAEMGFYLSRFDAISVRENSGIKYAKDNFGLDVEQVLDPVFLCPQDTFVGMAEKNKTRLPTESFLGTYIIHPTNQIADFIDNLQTSLKIENSCTIIAAAWTVDYGHSLWKKDFLEQAYVEELLACIQNCECFITDSFHGVCFSIIFKKKFIALCNSESQLKIHTRIYDLLRKFNLEERIFISLDNNKEAINILQKDINYDEVYAVLNTEIIRSKSWLSNALNKASSLKKNKSAYDILEQKVQDIEEKYNKLVSKETSNIWIIRKTKGFFRSLKNNGLNYTMILILKKGKNYLFRNKK